MKIDTGSEPWRAIEAHAVAEIGSAQKRLEATGLDNAATEYERGRIKALRNILALADGPSPVPEFDQQ